MPRHIFPSYIVEKYCSGINALLEGISYVCLFVCFNWYCHPSQHYNSRQWTLKIQHNSNITISAPNIKTTNNYQYNHLTDSPIHYSPDAWWHSLFWRPYERPTGLSLIHFPAGWWDRTIIFLTSASLVYLLSLIASAGNLC